MTVGNHVDLRARDLAVVNEIVGSAYEFVCADSAITSRGNSSMWKATLVGEMKGYSFYVHVQDGKIIRSSLLS
jgi:hypothetical protein